MRIGVVGLGVRGLTLAMVLQEYGGHQVLGFDTNPGRVVQALDLYKNNQSIHPDPELRYLLNHAHPLPLSPSLDSLVRYSDVIYLAVPALGPEPPVRDALVGLLFAMRLHPDRQFTVVQGRKVPVGANRKLLGGLGHPWGYCPILGAPHELVKALTDPPQIYVGTDTTEVGAVLTRVWTPVVNTREVVVDLPELIERHIQTEQGLS